MLLLFLLCLLVYRFRFAIIHCECWYFFFLNFNQYYHGTDISLNDWLFHMLNTITSDVSPNNNGLFFGIYSLRWDYWTLTFHIYIYISGVYVDFIAVDFILRLQSVCSVWIRFELINKNKLIFDFARYLKKCFRVPAAQTKSNFNTQICATYSERRNILDHQPK